MNPTHRRHGPIAAPGSRPLPGLAGLAALAALAALAWCLRRSPSAPRRVRVAGSSMVPTLEPGDRLLVRRAGRLRCGDIVALHDPRDQSRIMIKRVHAVTAAGLDVRGDNPSGSTDSRAFGLVTTDAVIGRAWYRYAPSGRTGRLASPGRAGS